MSNWPPSPEQIAQDKADAESDPLYAALLDEYEGPSYSDGRAAVAEIKRLRAALKASEESDAESLRMYRAARDERDRLRAELDALRPIWRPYVGCVCGATWLDDGRAKCEECGRLQNVERLGT